ncbi:hypothetical protein CYLTODRAFT_422234 [Cylindrobasidium torrendii FP15055 ss-10]|uniref:FAD/NAD(P)-binding domain-containing protein n=1 Tax=Cylindrobasidium torrendii FP15055 ss-10 TaxID=1314674 RepID=A0A0D7BDW9_9AGAR|nr:hypothetical protein CYLTODRAFT_422234 [Cylindrobasidium torrendii FP15055 ss-10]
MASSLLFVAFIPVILVLVWKAYRYHLLRSVTGYLDVLNLGHERCTKIQGTAVVCGGSIAGLLTARICRDHFTSVIIVEAEEWTSSPEARRKMPQTSNHTRSRISQYDSLQVCLRLLYLGLHRLFPGLAEECANSGIAVAPADYKTHFWGLPLIMPYHLHSGTLPNTMFASRQALETLLRRLTLGRYARDIRQVIGIVTGLRMGEDGYVDGVKVRMKDGKVDCVDAKLVIDCTGPAAAGRRWLRRAVGVDPNDFKDTLDPKIYYTTTRFVITQDLGARLPIPGGWDAVGGHIHVMFPDAARNGRGFLSIIKAEGNQLFICCGGWAMDRPIYSIEDIKTHTLEIPVDAPVPRWVLDMLDLLKEIEKDSHHSFVCVGPSYKFNYEQFPSLPHNFIAVGDSVSRVNSIFGQGCSKALVGAAALNTLLHKTTVPLHGHLPVNFSYTFFERQARKTRAIWNSTKAADYSQPTTTPMTGEPLDLGLRWRKYRRQITRLAVKDIVVGELLWRNNMMVDITSLDFYHPKIVAKVVWNIAVEKAQEMLLVLSSLSIGFLKTVVSSSLQA